MRKLWIAIIGIIVVIAAVGGGAIYYMSTQIESLVIYSNSGLRGKTTHEYFWVHLKNSGAKSIEIYQISFLPFTNLTSAFTQDIVVPPGAECIITFYVDGGPVTIENVAGTTTGGGNAVTNSANNPSPLKGSDVSWSNLQIYTRSGKTYEQSEIGITD